MSHLSNYPPGMTQADHDYHFNGSRYEQEEVPCPCIFCGEECDETCEELGPEAMPEGWVAQESHTSAALAFGLAWALALLLIGIMVIA